MSYRAGKSLFFFFFVASVRSLNCRFSTFSEVEAQKSLTLKLKSVPEAENKKNHPLHSLHTRKEGRKEEGGEMGKKEERKEGRMVGREEENKKGRKKERKEKRKEDRREEERI